MINLRQDDGAILERFRDELELGHMTTAPVDRHRIHPVASWRVTRLDDVQRERIVATVKQCAAQLGRAPRALEFFRWRLQRAPDSPSQMTVYRAFPGVWAEVLAATPQGLTKNARSDGQNQA